MKTKMLGRAGEAKAAEALRRKGYKILASGYRSRFGEIDLIASKGETLVFVEVKLRKNPDFAHAFENVTPAKMRKIRQTALMYLAEHGENWNCRFDIIEVYTDADEVNHLEGAFE